MASDYLDFVTMDDKHAVKHIANKIESLLENFSVKGMTEEMATIDLPSENGYVKRTEGDDVYIRIHLHRKYKWNGEGIK